MFRSFCLRWLLLLAAWLLAVPASADGPARLVADLVPESDEVLRPIDGFASIGSRTVFLRRDDDEDRLALWVTDGTSDGTRLIAILCPPCGNTALLGSTGSIAFLRVRQGYSGVETRIWRTDGTPAGTFPVTGSFQMPEGRPGFLSALAAGRLFFTACTPELGCELWSSDGWPAGTAPVGEVVRGPESGDFRELAAAGGRVFLIAGEPGGEALWLADGAGRGLMRLRDTPQARLLTAAGGRVFFIAQAAGLELWTSDGTAAGTRPVTAFAPQDPFAHTWFLRPAGDRVYFAADDGANGVELWSSAASAGSPRRLTDFNDRSADFGNVEKVGNRIVFLVSQKQRGFVLWSSLGDFRSTSALTGCQVGCPRVESSLAGVGDGRLVFYAHNRGKDGFWVTDGTAGGTRLLQRSEHRYDYVQWTVAGGRVLFEIANEYAAGELWITDGSGAGTFFVTSGGPRWSHYYGFADKLRTGAANGRLLFPVQTSDTVYREVLWSSDGSLAGSRPLLQSLVARGSYPSRLMPFRDGLLAQNCTGKEWELRFVRGAETTRFQAMPYDRCDGDGVELVEVGGVAVFVLYRDGVVSLWRSDGTPEGTTAVVPLAASFGVESMTRFRGQAAFWTFPTFAPGPPGQLWLTDGTAAGTRKLLDLPPQVGMYGLTSFGDKLYFFNVEWRGGDFATRPWVSDGTPAGTQPLTGADFPNMRHLPLDWAVFTELDGRVYFPLALGDGPLELWSTDSTPGGTGPAVTAASGMLLTEAATAKGGSLYFAARRRGDPSGRLLPWISDGTDVGTLPLADLDLRSDAFAPADQPRFTELDGRIYFAASDAAHGDELWSTDGTPEGTKLVRDVAAGTLGSYPRGLTIWRGRLYFRARDPVHGMELWTSDGTAEGTRLVQDIAAGPFWSVPQELTAGEEGLYFSANDGAHGRELWLLPADVLGGYP